MMLPALTPLARLALLAVLGTLAACGSTKDASSVDVEPWLVPNPRLRLEIEQQAERLPWTHGVERVELIRWFAGVGEPAYPTLLAMTQDPRPDVVGAAYAALGATRDSRLVPHLRDLPWMEEEYRDLNLERARTMLRLGDWSVVPRLVDGLGDERLVTRALCAQALYEATHERFGYDPQAAPEEREAAIERWREWWSKRREDPLIRKG